MKSKIMIIPAVFVWLLMASCADDEKGDISASVIGTWSGNKAEFKINPKGIIPPFTKTEDDFPIRLEFKNNGEVVLTDKNQTATTGTYQLNGRDLTINIDYEFEYINMSGIYLVEELTMEKFRASIEKEGTYKHHETGESFDGKVKSTLYFDRQSK